MQVTLGIIDLTPATMDRVLPSIFTQTLQCAPHLALDRVTWSQLPCTMKPLQCRDTQR